MILLVYISTFRHTHKQACNQDFAKGGALKLNIFFLKNASSRLRAEQSVATKSYHVDEGLGAKPLLLGDFFYFSEKRLLFQRHLDHISHVFKAI